MIENKNDYINSIELINEKLAIILKQYDRTDLYLSSLDKAIKKESQKLSIPTTAQKSVAYLNKKKWLASKAIGVVGGAATTVATGAIASTIINGAYSFITTPVSNLAASSGILKPILVPIATTYSTYTYGLSIAVGVSIAGVFAYFCFRFVYHFLRKVSKGTIRWLNEKYGFNPKILDLLPTENLLLENPLFCLQYLLLTLSVVSQLERAFYNRGIEFSFDIEKLVMKMENNKGTLSEEEQLIYDLVQQDAKAFVGQIETIAGHPEKITNLKRSKTYEGLIGALQETSTINFNDDKKTSTYLAITSHVIDQRCNPQQLFDFFRLLKEAFHQYLPSRSKTLVESSHTMNTSPSNPVLEVSHNQNDRNSQMEFSRTTNSPASNPAVRVSQMPRAAFHQYLPSQPKRLVESSQMTNTSSSNPGLEVSYNQNDRNSQIESSRTTNSPPSSRAARVSHQNDRDSQNESYLPNRLSELQQNGHFKNNSNHSKETRSPVINILFN